MAIFELYPVCTWQVPGFAAISFPVENISEDGGNRLVPRERARRDGAKHDDTGSRAKRYTLRCSFHTGSEEPDVPNVELLYPDILNELMRSFDVHEVGTLTLPTKGIRRCRAESYSRVEDMGERDAASVTLTFVEDNEDGTTSASFSAPSARSLAKNVAQEATASLDSMGCDATDFGTSLNEMAAAIETLAGAPSEFVADIVTQAAQVRSATARIQESFSGGEDGQGALLLDPIGSRVYRALATFADTASRAAGEKLAGEPRLTSVRYGYQVSLFQVAADYAQDFVKLQAANPQVGDPFAIPARTPINVYS